MYQRKALGRQKARKVIPLMLSVSSRCDPIFEDSKYRNPWDYNVGEHSFSDQLKITQASKSKRRENDITEIQSKMINGNLVSKSRILDHYSSSSEMIQVTWIGHACMLIQMNGLNILTDPIWSDRFGPTKWFGPKRFFPPPLLISDLPPIHIVLLSHNHYENLDEPTVKILGNQPKYFVPMGLKNWFSKRGITNCSEMTWWQSDIFNNSGCEFEVICTPTQHWSGRSPFDRLKSLWSSWVVINKNSHKRLFFGGDTGYCPVFEQIGREFGPFDVAAIPIGSYEPRNFMANQHCTPEEAVFIHKDIKSKQSLAISWGTFPSAEDAWSQPILDLKEAKEKHEVPTSEFVGCCPGESLLVGSSAFRQFLEEEKDAEQKSSIICLSPKLKR